MTSVLKYLPFILSYSLLLCPKAMGVCLSVCVCVGVWLCVCVGVWLCVCVGVWLCVGVCLCYDNLTTLEGLLEICEYIF